MSTTRSSLGIRWIVPGITVFSYIVQMCSVLKAITGIYRIVSGILFKWIRVTAHVLMKAVEECFSTGRSQTVKFFLKFKRLNLNVKNETKLIFVLRSTKRKR